MKVENLNRANDLISARHRLKKAVASLQDSHRQSYRLQVINGITLDKPAVARLMTVLGEEAQRIDEEYKRQLEALGLQGV